MDARGGTGSAAHEAREPAAGSAAGAAGEPAGLVPPGGGTILDAIGDTPLVMVDGIWVKLEHRIPGRAYSRVVMAPPVSTDAHARAAAGFRSGW